MYRNKSHHSFSSNQNPEKYQDLVEYQNQGSIELVKNWSSLNRMYTDFDQSNDDLSEGSLHNE